MPRLQHLMSWPRNSGSLFFLTTALVSLVRCRALAAAGLLGTEHTTPFPSQLQGHQPRTFLRVPDDWIQMGALAAAGLLGTEPTTKMWILASLLSSPHKPARTSVRVPLDSGRRSLLARPSCTYISPLHRP